MGGTSTIDWSKYSSPASSADGQIDFGKYAGEAEPGAREIPEVISPVAHPSVMSMDPRSAVAQTLGREVKAAGQTITQLPSSVASAFSAPATLVTGISALDRFGTGLHRMISEPIEHAAEWYKREAQAKTSGVSTLDKMLTVAPEGIGLAAGNVVLGKTLEALPGAPRAINEAIPSFKREAQHFQAIENIYGDRPVNATRTLVKAQTIADRMNLTKLKSVPGPVNELINRISGGEQPKIAGMDAAEFQRRAPEAYQNMVDAGAIQPAQPLTIKEARQFRTDLNSAIYDQELPSQFRGPLKDLADTLHKETVAAFPTQTAKNWYLATNKEANRAYAMQRKADAIGPYIGGGLGAYAGEKLGGVGGLGVGAYLGAKAGRVVGKPIVGGMVRSILNRNIGQVTPPPGAIENIMQAAKAGTISPGKATTMLSNMGVSTKVNVPYWKAKTYPETGASDTPAPRVPSP